MLLLSNEESHLYGTVFVKKITHTHTHIQYNELPEDGCLEPKHVPGNNENKRGVYRGADKSLARPD